MEVRSADSGTLAEFFAAVNDDVQVGAALFRVSSDGSSVAPSTTTTSTASSSAAKGECFYFCMADFEGAACFG